MSKGLEVTKTMYRDEYGKFLTGWPGPQKRYNSAEEMLERAIPYLERIEQEKRTPTVSGLALALGFRDRRSLLNYQKEEGYEFAHDVVQYLKLKIEEYLEERLLDYKNTNIAGLIFNLKNNFNWCDKSEIKLDSRTLTFNGFEIEGLNERTIKD